MDTQHFQAKILQIKQIAHISQGKVHLQVDRYVRYSLEEMSALG